jgi:hypothetical protein
MSSRPDTPPRVTPPESSTASKEPTMTETQTSRSALLPPFEQVLPGLYRPDFQSRNLPPPIVSPTLTASPPIYRSISSDAAQFPARHPAHVRGERLQSAPLGKILGDTLPSPRRREVEPLNPLAAPFEPRRDFQPSRPLKRTREEYSPTEDTP